MKLLTTNYKLNKDSGFTVKGLDLAPGKTSGYEVCPQRGICMNVCIGLFSGFHVMDNVRQAQKNRTKWFFEDRLGFLRQLHKELQTLEKKTNPACRLNIDSDLDWIDIDPTLFKYNILHYNYTKVFSRCSEYIKGNYPNNYHLCYSWNEKSDKRKVNQFLKNGGTINVVSSIRYKANDLLPIPKTFKIATKTWPTSDFDKQDVRCPQKDGKGIVGIVRAKIAKKHIPRIVKKKFFIEGNKV